MSKISSNIKSLINYGISKELLSKEDEVYTQNRLLEIMELDSIDADAQAEENTALEEVLKVLLDDACERGICEDSVVFRDLFDTKLIPDSINGEVLDFLVECKT